MGVVQPQAGVSAPTLRLSRRSIWLTALSLDTLTTIAVTVGPNAAHSASGVVGVSSNTSCSRAAMMAVSCLQGEGSCDGERQQEQQQASYVRRGKGLAAQRHTKAALHNAAVVPRHRRERQESPCAQSLLLLRVHAGTAWLVLLLPDVFTCCPAASVAGWTPQ